MMRVRANAARQLIQTTPMAASSISGGDSEKGLSESDTDGEVVGTAAISE